MEKSYRIKANVGKDQVLNVNLQRDVDMYEVLSLKLSQEKLYKLHSSGYGVIVGRVLANDAFGVPNAKVSVFIPIKDEDKTRSDIKELYPYGFVNSYDSNNRRFNILPNYQVADCHKPVGTFPSKRNVLDEDIEIEVYDKYYKYTTITNNAGDYMIFGVPTGEQIVHVDIDLSDIGVLSQRPTDFIYKGYDINLFESASEFKQSTNLNELPQIIYEDSSVNVYPLWGDKDENEIAITRKDIRIQYKFEPTCVFIGSVITDSPSNSISQTCTPGNKLGEASQLRASEGTIEMIRKTVNDAVEEFNIKGNKLIDGNGVWCYQIPMNLDYVCTDEYGNIVPTDNPTKGIPTRARVRFRVTLDESENESLSSHKARYLIPNNPEMYKKETSPYIKKDDKYYEFGTVTPDDCFRDLLWNKVYSVKSYIPRIQKPFGVDSERCAEYTGIKGVNKKGASGINPLPFNKLNLNFSIPSYFILRELWRGESDTGNDIRKFWRFLNGKQIPYNIDAVRERIMEDMDSVGLDFYNDWINGCLYFPAWYWYLASRNAQDNADKDKYDSQFCDCDEQQKHESKLCVLNNCSFAYTNRELRIDKKYSNRGDIESSYTKLVYGSTQFENGIIKKTLNKDGLAVYYYSFGQKRYPGKNFYIDKDGKRHETAGDGMDEYYEFVRLFSTDIILLGSLNECDIHGIPKITYNLPSTTSNIPPMGSLKPQINDEDEDTAIDDESYLTNKSTVNGMHWGEYWFMNGELHEIKTESKYHHIYENILGSGLFFGLTTIHIEEPKKKKSWLSWAINPIGSAIDTVFGTNVSNWLTPLIIPGTIGPLISLLWGGKKYGNFLIPYTDIKSCVNAERLCELGVTNDSEIDVPITGKEDSSPRMYAHMDGLITRREILDNDTRALFATLNCIKLIAEIDTDATGYKTYNLKCLYPTNFDGRLEELAPGYTGDEDGNELKTSTHDVRSKDYMDFRFGSIQNNPVKLTNVSAKVAALMMNGATSTVRHFYGQDGVSPNSFPLYENSFYFYFGINSAHNAISEFYKNFLTICTNNKIEPFKLEINAIPSSICQQNGKIVLTANGLVLPAYILLKNEKGEEIVNETRYYTNNVTIANNLQNGKYTLTITDSTNKSITEDIFLKQEKVKANFSVITGIQTKYREGMDICSNEQYGILKISSYNLNGVLKTIDTLQQVSAGEKLVFSAGDCIITIAFDGNDSASNYYCGYEGNEIHFGKPGGFILRIEENNCKLNYTDSRFNISDAGEIDLYINTMPLKFFVGLTENIISSYAKHFHTGYIQETVDSVRGWFDVHNPKNYDKAFWDDATTRENKDLWYYENIRSNENDTLKNKFKKLFNVASNVYITNGTTNRFNVIASGDKTLLRASYPKYDNFSEIEQVGTFASFITCNNGETSNCPQNGANIVAGNFRFTDSNGRPTYDESEFVAPRFNPKYENSKNQAGNYFAAFSNNANYITDCTKATTDKKCIVVPYGANDLSEDGLCIGSDKKDLMLSNVYKAPPFFKTEFIDRRLDYDLAYVTPCTTTDKKSGKNRTWANGRLSGLTYNGIEMAYAGQYVISSDGGDTEYNYDSSKMSLWLNESERAKKKTLYSSELEYGGTRSLDLRTLYYSKNRKVIDEDTFNNDGIKVHDHSGDAALNTNEYDNFGLSSDRNTILGYPTKRLVDLYNIPYGRGTYTWKGQSCLYDTDFDDYISIKAKGAEIISNACDFSNSLAIDSNKVTYKVKDSGSYLFGANAFNHKSTINEPLINGLKPQLKGVKLIRDTEQHESLVALKTTTTEGKTLAQLFAEKLSDDIAATSGKITINKTGLSESSTKFIGVGIYHMFENSSYDNLLKRVRIFNLSNYYNINDITFKPDTSGDGWIVVKDKNNTEVDKETVVVKSDVTGTFEGSDTITIGEESATVTIGGDIDNGKGEGKPEENPKGKTKTEVMYFLLTTNAFTYDEIVTGSTTMKIELGGDPTYTPTLEEKGTKIRVSVTLSSNNVLLTSDDNDEDARITLTIPLKSGIDYILKFNINKNGAISDIS